MAIVIERPLGRGGSVETVLRTAPDLEVKVIEKIMLRMSGAFRSATESIKGSKNMTELSLLPAVRTAGAEDLIVADGIGCRHQIHKGMGRDAIHVALFLNTLCERFDLHVLETISRRTEVRHERQKNPAGREWIRAQGANHSAHPCAGQI